MNSHETTATIRIDEIKKGDIVRVYDTTFTVDTLRDISMARGGHHHIHVEGKRLSNGSRVGLNLYALDTVELIK